MVIVLYAKSLKNMKIVLKIVKNIKIMLNIVKIGGYFHEVLFTCEHLKKKLPL